MSTYTTKLEPFARGFLACESDVKIKKISAGLLAWAKEGDLKIYPHTGLCNAQVEGVVEWSFGTVLKVNEKKLARYIEKYPEEEAELRRICGDMAPYNRHVSYMDFYSEEQRRHCIAAHLWGGRWMGHSNPDFNLILDIGTDGLREKVAKYRQINKGNDDFYDALDTTLDALDIIGERLAEKAVAMMAEETDPIVLKRLEALAETFSYAPKKPCRDFRDASIVYSMIFTVDGTDSPGHFDQYMYKFWKVTDPDIRMEYLCNVWKFFKDVRAWNLCISGSDENWNDLTNDLTYAILEMVKKYKYNTPNLTFRWHRNTPEKLMRAVHGALCAGCGLPALYNDEVVCVALQNMGIPADDAHRYVMNGCNQIDIQGKSHMGLEDGEVLIAKAVELALHNGIAPMSGERFGPETGDPCTFGDFEEFYAAFIRQLDHLTDMATSMSNVCQELYAREAPNPLRSLLIEGCVERATDYKNGGPLYGNGQILAEGVADAADSLAAIKKYVYEDKRITMQELIEALKADFEGYEDMRHMLKKSELKFGNDIDYVDEISVRTIDHFNSHLLTIKTFRGGVFSGGCSPFSRAAKFGATLAALPNGRKNGETLIADSIGATPGCDTNGPTALLKSCLKYDHTLAGSGFILNLKFDKSIFNSKAGEDAFLALWRTYFEDKGQMITATVVSAEDLLDAQINPDAHRDLIVRVGGYSGYFIRLNRSLQENVIARTLN